MQIWREELNCTTKLMAWWTDNDPDTDFAIVGEASGCPSFNLSYMEAKQLYKILGEKFQRKDCGYDSSCEKAATL